MKRKFSRIYLVRWSFSQKEVTSRQRFASSTLRKSHGSRTESLER